MTIDRRALSRRSSDAAARLKTVAARAGRLPTEDGDTAARPAKPGRSDYLAVKAALQERLLDEIGERGLLENDDADVAAAVQDFAARAIASEEVGLNDAERVRLAEELTEETIGMGPLAPLLADPAVSDILVNAPDKVYVERFGRLERTDVRFRDAEHIVRVIERIAARVGRRIDTASPMVDLRLPDGSRVNATLPPATIDGPTLSIRRFGRRRLRRDDLLSLGTVSPEILEFLVIAVRARKNILISGGTGAGKSTLLGVLAEAIPDHERIVTIEDTAELSLDQEHVVRMETRPVNIEGRGRITARDLVINALRMRPDRIIVGEVRGAEALDMLQAMNTGHDGGIGTDPRELDPRRAVAARDDGADGGHGAAVARRARADRLGHPPAGAGAPLRRRRQADRVGRGDYGPRRADPADAGALRVPAARQAGPARDRTFRRDRRDSAHGGRTARRGHPDSGGAVPALRGLGPVTAAIFSAMLATGVLYRVVRAPDAPDRRSTPGVDDWRRSRSRRRLKSRDEPSGRFRTGIAWPRRPPASRAEP